MTIFLIPRLKHKRLKETMQLMACFPTNGQSFYPSSAALGPPTRLCEKLLPAIDEWHGRLAAKKLSPYGNDPIQVTVTANAFIQVIMMIKKTIIQDSGLTMEHRPCHPIWQHSIFSDPAYLSFKT
jgi:hypothetical protein